MSSEPPGEILHRERTHPAAVLIAGVAAVRENVLVIVVLVVLSASGGGFEAGDLRGALTIVPLVGALAVAAGLWDWATTTFSLTAHALTLHTGVFGKSETTVPLERVQALDEVRGPLHRLFRVVRVDVQTAGGGAGGEISLKALDAGTLETVRAAIGRRRGGEVVPPPAPGPARRLGRGALAAAAVTSGSLGVLVPVVAFVPAVADELIAGDPDEKEGAAALLDLAPDTVAEWLTLAAGVVGAAWLLSVLGVIVAFAGFSVERLPDRLVIRRGLLQRRTATVPVARVQAVRVVEGVLRQPFGLASVRVEVAGYAQEMAAAQTLFPLLRTRAVPALVREMLPEMPHEMGPLTPAPRRSLRRYVLAPVLVSLVAAGAAALALRSPLPLLVAVPAAAHGVLAYRAAGVRVREGRLALRFRRLARTTLLGPLRLTQGHSVRQSVLQRRAGLADFEIALGADAEARVRHLEAADAWAAFAAASS